MMPIPSFRYRSATGAAVGLMLLASQPASAQTASPAQTVPPAAITVVVPPVPAAVADVRDAPVLDDAALAGERGGQAIVVGNQTLNSSLSGNAITGNYTAGAISLSDNAFANFNGMGNIVINSGAQANLQSAMNITINLGN